MPDKQTTSAHKTSYDVAVIGGGPAGLAAAIGAAQSGASVLLVEREARLGGILKQCIHDGFGLLRFGEKLSGPEYAQRFMAQLHQPEITGNITVQTLTFVTGVENKQPGFSLSLVGRAGLAVVDAKALVLATGCRERTARQVSIHGTRPAGIFTAGSAQYYTNILGQLPTRRCVILGSGDIGLIMARRLTLEGAAVEGVYEAKPTPGGLSRNIAQCLHDFDIPLHLSHTVTRVFGHNRLTGVEICEVDTQMRPIDGTARRVDCDALILSVGLIPENELAESLHVPLAAATKGPVCDQNGMTLVDGVFTCGNAAHVNDLVDYVSESGETAGRAAAAYASSSGTRELAGIQCKEGFLYAIPQRLSLAQTDKKAVLYFRVAEPVSGARVRATLRGQPLFEKRYRQLRPPEMERFELDLSGADIHPGDEILLEMEVDAHG